jgi:nitrilase
MRIAAIQMNSGADVGANLRLADRLIDAARDGGCELVVLPENFALMPAKSRDKAAHAERPGEGPIQDWLGRTARRAGVWIVGGSIPQTSPDPDRVYGACPVVAPDGTQRACYRKIHLFDVKLPDAGESYRESWSMYPGDEPAVVDTPAGRLGLTICYDLRFPELYRKLVDLGATVFTVPAAFTVPTGRAHWQTLLRARAIENLAYVVAPGQYGEHPDGRSTFGHSLIVDPWGRVLAEATDSDCHVVADVDPELPARLREDFPALRNRRL